MSRQQSAVSSQQDKMDGLFMAPMPVKILVMMGNGRVGRVRGKAVDRSAS